MLSDHCYELLETAAARTFERIRRDRAGASERLQPILAFLEEYLFDPTLNVNRVQRAFGVRNGWMLIEFQTEVGRAPRDYIEHRRLETACGLLGTTELKIWQIAELVGFSSLPTFSRAFKRWAGENASVYRRKAAGTSGAGRVEPAPDDGGRFSDPEWLRRAAAGELAADEARVLMDRLWRLYPPPMSERKRGRAGLAPP